MYRSEDSAAITKKGDQHSQSAILEQSCVHDGGHSPACLSFSPAIGAGRSVGRSVCLSVCLCADAGRRRDSSSQMCFSARAFSVPPKSVSPSEPSEFIGIHGRRNVVPRGRVLSAHIHYV